jgi:glucose/arabinose dehydrogenase
MLGFASKLQAEELNRFKEEDAGKHWGYPWCWTEFKVPEPYGMGQGTIWAWPSFLDDGDITDEQCRAEYVPPVMALQGHSAPLGITFYEWKPAEERPESCPPHVAFPESMDGYAFIAYHGSWNRDIPTGYKVVYVAMDENGDPVGTDPVDLLAHEPPNAEWSYGFRPVDVSFDDCGRLLISSDGSRDLSYGGSMVVRMEYTGVSNHYTPDVKSGAETPAKLAVTSGSYDLLPWQLTGSMLVLSFWNMI